MSGKNEQGKIDVTEKNVYGKPLHQHSSAKSQPSYISDTTLKSGLCTESSPIAATLTKGFLDFAQKRGVDFRMQGVTEGQRWCIGANRWKETLDAGYKDTPKIKLESTHKEALKTLDLKLLEKWAEQDLGKNVVKPDGKGDNWARESDQIGGKEPKS